MTDKSTLKSLLQMEGAPNLEQVIDQFILAYNEADQVAEQAFHDKRKSYEEHVDKSKPRIHGLFRNVGAAYYQYCEDRQIEEDEEWGNVLFCLEILASKLHESEQSELDDIPEAKLDDLFDKLMDCWIYDFRMEDHMRPAVEEVLGFGSEIITLKRMERVFGYYETMDDDSRLIILSMLFKRCPKVLSEVNRDVPSSGWEDPVV